MQWLINRRDELGRKFEADDVSEFAPSEVSSMCDWLRDYRGSFSFLVDLKQTLQRTDMLSRRQLAGLANSIYANERNNTRRTLDETPDRPVTVNFDEESNVPTANFEKMATIEDILEMSKALDRRFERDDLFTPGVVAFAYRWLLDYTGSFEFVVSVREKLLADGELKSTSQIAGTLNCAVVDHGRQQSRERRQAQQLVRNGHYTIKFDDGSHVTLRVQDHWDTVEQQAGTQVIGFLSGSNNESDYTGFANIRHGSLYIWKRFQGRVDKQRRAWDILVNGDADEFGQAYALESGRCYRCNRLLTTPESIERGLGPICAEIM